MYSMRLTKFACIFTQDFTSEWLSAQHVKACRKWPNMPWMGACGSLLGLGLVTRKEPLIVLEKMALRKSHSCLHLVVAGMNYFVSNKAKLV